MAIYIVAWFAVVLPLIGAGGSFFADSARRAGQVCRAFAATSFLLTLVVLGTRLKTAGAAPFDSVLTFFSMNPTDTSTFTTRFEPLLGVHVDSLTAVIAAVTAFVGVAVQSYASTVLRGDPSYRRFYWASSLLLFAAAGLAYSPNLLQFLVMAGIASAAVYILMLHWWQREDAAAPARRIFVTLFGADLALLLAVGFVFLKFGVFASQQPAAPPGQDIFDPFSFAGLATIVPAALHHQIAGVGLRSLEVMSILVLVFALVRAAQVPFHLWFEEASNAPLPVTALITATAGIGGAYLLAREYPLLLAAPHVLSALALVGAATTAVCGALAFVQRDIYRAGTLVTAALLGVSVTAFGVGGFSEGTYALAAASVLTALFFCAASSVVRAYRTRELAEMGGAWRRMRVTSIALGAWAAAAAGVSLSLYHALAAAFANRFPNGGHLSGAARALTITLLIAGGAAVSISACALAARVLRGEPARRRGFQPERVADLRDTATRWALVLLAATAVLVLVALPGLGPVSTGRGGQVAFTWTQFIVYGGTQPVAGVSMSALLVTMALVALGVVDALLLQPAWGRLPRRGAMYERGLALAGRPFLAAGALVTRFDERVNERLAQSVGEAIDAGAIGAERTRGLAGTVYFAGAAAVVGLVVALSLLAATGHLGGVTL